MLLNVLMFSGDYWPDSGGIAAHVHYISHALARRGINVHLVGGHRLPAGVKHASTRAGEGLPREATFRRSGPAGVRAAIFLFRAWLYVRRASRLPWDIVHFHNFLPDGLLLGYWNWPTTHARVMTNHSAVLLDAVMHKRSLLWMKYSIRMVDGIIAPSEELATVTGLIMHEGQRVTYIPNGVDVARFSPGPAGEPDVIRWRQSGAGKVLVAVRRHDPKCGLDILLRAVPTVVREYPDVSFVLVGDGAETRRLVSLVAELEIGKWVTFVGRVPHSKLPQVYRASYASLLPSIYEAVSLSGLESLACGCPVIGSRVGGIPDFVRPGITGLLVEPRSPHALADAMLELLRNPTLREFMALQGRQLVEKEFSWDTIAGKTLEFYGMLG